MVCNARLVVSHATTRSMYRVLLLPASGESDNEPTFHHRTALVCRDWLRATRWAVLRLFNVHHECTRPHPTNTGRFRHELNQRDDLAFAVHAVLLRDDT